MYFLKIENLRKSRFQIADEVNFKLKYVEPETNHAIYAFHVGDIVGIRMRITDEGFCYTVVPRLFPGCRIEIDEEKIYEKDKDDVLMVGDEIWAKDF